MERENELCFWENLCRATPFSSVVGASGASDLVGGGVERGGNFPTCSLFQLLTLLALPPFQLLTLLALPPFQLLSVVVVLTLSTVQACWLCFLVTVFLTILDVACCGS
jgi:hypothetical protein